MKKKGFTLIELLAVIIILGILMIIAIPSVTSYINNSRKESYVSTVKELIKAASNKANSGDLDMYDIDTTYYIPVSALELENGKAKSPFGEFDEAYVVVTYNGEEYDYYYVGKDETDMGIGEITEDTLISSNYIKSNIGTIDTTIGIRGTKNVVVFDQDLNKGESQKASKKVFGDGKSPKVCPESYTETIYWALQDNNNDGVNEKLVISDKEVDGALHGSIPGNMEYSNTKPIPWIVVTRDSDPNHLSRNVTNVVVEGTVAPVNAQFFFFGVGYDAPTFYADLEGLQLCHTKGVHWMFTGSGNNASSYIIKNIEDLDVSNIVTISGMFRNAGPNATTWSIGDLSDWNPKNAVWMEEMFTGAGKSAANWSIGDISEWDVSKVRNMNEMFYEAGYYSSSFNLDISNWNMSQISLVEDMFKDAGKNASTWNVKIPKTNSNGIDNNETTLFGKTTSKFVNSPEGRFFTVAN